MKRWKVVARSSAKTDWRFSPNLDVVAVVGVQAHGDLQAEGVDPGGVAVVDNWLAPTVNSMKS